MEVYKFKCKCCGSVQYEKIDDKTYECQYCGNREEIVQKTIEKIIIKESFSPEEKMSYIAQKKEAMISELINVIIIVFLGAFGVHKFLKGRIFLGVIYLLTYGLFGIGLLVDSVKALRRLIFAAKEYRISKS